GGTMEKEQRQNCLPPRYPRKSLRLTFLVSNGKVKLVSYERLPMICPPQYGEIPEAGKHGGFWMELRDANNRVLAHRLISPTLLNSVEVHSPDGKMERKFGEAEGVIFEVLLPDEAAATSAVLMGEPLIPTKKKTPRREPSCELARFEIPSRGTGGES
ncbi:MAG: hypothetical protein ACU83N_14090, partial [Gammaproteobacteria bacterium]